MKNIKRLQKIITILVIIILINIICIPQIYATIRRPSDVTGSDETIEDFGFEENLTNALTTIGTFIAVGVLMVIGIKYMAGSLEEKAQYKKTMLPYIIGCILLFGASTIAPKIIEIFKDVDETEELGNVILGLIQTIGTFVAVGVLMVLGIRYMLGSTEERASYKKTMLPYLIGAVLIFGAVNLTAMIYDIVMEGEQGGSSTTGPNIKYCQGCGKQLTAKEAIKGRCATCQQHPNEGIK